jgi:hypothetical protein
MMTAQYSDPVEAAIKTLALVERQYLRALALGETFYGPLPKLLELRGLVHAGDGGPHMLTELGYAVEHRLRHPDGNGGFGRLD